MHMHVHNVHACVCTHTHTGLQCEPQFCAQSKTPTPHWTSWAPLSLLTGVVGVWADGTLGAYPWQESPTLLW